MLPIYRYTKQAQIITALILTGILSVGSGLTLIKNASASSIDFLAETPNERLKQNVRVNRLPRLVANAVLRDLSNREGISSLFLKITDYRQQTWRNGCLELQRPDELCSQALVPGWRVVVSRGQQSWIYHTNQNGSVVRLNERANTGRLPQNVRNAVLAQARQISGLPTRALSIVEFQPTNWVEGCEVSTFPNPCDQILVSGWQVTVGAGNQRWVFVSNENGDRVRLATGSNPSANLPTSIIDEVLADASNRSRTKIAVSSRNITQAERVVWSNGCLDLDGGVCTFAQVPGWRVTVTIGRERFVYHTDNNFLVKFNRAASTTTGNVNSGQPIPISESELPPPLDRNVVFRSIASGGFTGRTYETILLNDGRLIRVQIGDGNGSERSVRRLSRQELQQFQQLLQRYRGEFNNLRYPAPRSSADFITYTLTSQEGTVEYNDISVNSVPTNLQAVITAWNQINDTPISDDGNLNPVPIRPSELPPPLDQGVVFREISSGGFAGRTYETVLRDDGLLIRVRIGDANDSERSVRRIPVQQVRQFQRLLERRSEEFQNINYPAPRGAADFITYTLTSEDGTVQYNDVSQNNLPQDLQGVVQAWRDIVGNR
ncbi:conserved hypothetical protein [Trichormus variabilis ATCC 29413]|uniref:Uncharacterized protein n=2 Tax=Anabaena variabilis TaxID=264691 RepID=Q3ME88_TRIV2|nr:MULTISPECIES: hypothetical protein [Nostocaceae]ABA20698.1 conserved hypothetical protein [Trichormus variabilis ATCC 29413]MBC1214417.1 hypothetical protein [Trichormus variabilis ARAD]MBC1255313.1 hypothetical protein [Trichormus variabilis V5]MBC1267776.1 hypothetical protein [Trichormus variabilis FSR]MBC1300877.1 hypothetical protein [Trichormus variabilis N2B]